MFCMYIKPVDGTCVGVGEGIVTTTTERRMIETSNPSICLNNNRPVTTTAVTRTYKTFHSVAKLTENSIAVSLSRPFRLFSMNTYLFRYNMFYILAYSSVAYTVKGKKSYP